MYIARKYIQYRIIDGPQSKYRAIIYLKGSTEKCSLNKCEKIWLEKPHQNKVEMKSKEESLTLTKSNIGV